MKGNLKNVELFLLIIFLIITVPLVYSIYDFQEQLAKDLGISPEIIAKHTDVTILKLIGFFIIQIFIGSTGVFFVFRELKKHKTNEFADLLDETIYLDKKTSTSNKEEGAQTNTTSTIDLETQINNISKTLTLKEYCNQSIALIATHFEICQGVFYISSSTKSKKMLSLIGGYAYYKPEDGETTFMFGEGLAGQVAKAQKIINIKNIPNGYINIISGLGNSSPKNLLIVPLVNKEVTIGVMELASFKSFTSHDEVLISRLSELIVEELVSKENQQNI